MDRILKFRYVWKHKESGYINILPYTLSDIQRLKDVFDKERFDLVSRDQYTGLEDKNGKEIYEGDIVKVLFDTHTIKDSLSIMTGKIDFYMGSFVLTFAEPHNGYSLMDKLKNTIKQLEIIGNKYENPEFLNEQI